MDHIVIIGNGIAGVTAARHIRKMSDNKITIVSAESDHFFSRTALMYIYMGHMKYEHTKPYEDKFWKENKLDLIKDYVTTVDSDAREIHLAKAGKIKYDKLIIASGSKSNYFDWPGQDAKGVIGMVNLQDLKALEENTPGCKRAVIIGGGLIGIELSEMLHSRKIPVTMLVREDSFWRGVLPQEESEMINREIIRHGVDLRVKEELKEILTDGDNKCIGVVTKKGEKIPCDVVGLTVGVSPNIAFLKDSKIETEKGILVNRYLETNIKNIYAIGDCAQQREAVGERKPVEAVWYTGRIMGETLALTICGERTAYNPGPWFNSAKFMNIEYSTYGWVWAEERENISQFYWEHERGSKGLRVAYERESRLFTGINLFGIRMRHAFFDHALRNKWTVDQLMKHLTTANFDPEFYSRHEKEIVSAFENCLV